MRVEALDAEGDAIDGLSKDDCVPLTADRIRHLVKWGDTTDCHLIRARLIRL